MCVCVCGSRSLLVLAHSACLVHRHMTMSGACDYVRWRMTMSQQLENLQFFVVVWVVGWDGGGGGE